MRAALDGEKSVGFSKSSILVEVGPIGSDLERPLMTTPASEMLNLVSFRDVRASQRFTHSTIGHCRSLRSRGGDPLMARRGHAPHQYLGTERPFPSRQDPSVAQVILSSIATSIMTVVSIVFTMVLMTLSLHLHNSHRAS